MNGNKLENMLLGIAIILFAISIKGVLPTDENIIILIIALIGISATIRSYKSN